jgi:hypothetical protein
MRVFGIAKVASYYKKEFNTESTENAESTEKNKPDRLKPVLQNG